MSGTGSDLCCSNPGALVVIAALPLCQAQAALEGVEGGFLDDLPASRHPEAFAADSLAPVSEDADAVFDGYGDFPFPSRCVCMMDCADAVALMEEAGHAAI